jgi:translation initiation factor IF-2
MADQPSIRLNKVLREFNISLDRVVDYLAQQGVEIEARPTTKISNELYQLLLDEFETDKSKKDASFEISEEKRKEKEKLRKIQEEKELERQQALEQKEQVVRAKVDIEKPKMLGKIDLNPVKKPVAKQEKPAAAPQAEVEKDSEVESPSKPTVAPAPPVAEKNEA